MKNILAIVIIVSALIIILNKKLAIYSSWVKVPAEITELKKVLDNKNIGNIRYKYKIKNKEYEGNQMMKIDKEFNKLITSENKKMNVYYHRLNPELSIRFIPMNYEDYILGSICLFGGLYLYLFSCENCVCPNVSSSSIIPNSITSAPILSNLRTFG